MVAHDPRPEGSTRGVLIVRDFKEMDRLPTTSGFSPRRPHQMGKAKAHRCFPKISSSITSRGTNHSEGSRGNSRVAPTTDSLAGGGPIAPASPSPERGERSPSQEWRQQLASSYLRPPAGPAPVRETRRSSSASDLTRCSRSRMACLETDWVGSEMEELAGSSVTSSRVLGR